MLMSNSLSVRYDGLLFKMSFMVSGRIFEEVFMPKIPERRHPLETVFFVNTIVVPV